MIEEPSDLSPEFRKVLDRLPTPAEADVDVEAALRQVKARIHQERVGTPWRTNMIRIAAALVVVLGASLIWRASVSRHGPQLAASLDYHTQPGQRMDIRLADGSTVVLGPGSRLQVPNNYPPYRVVALSGEALFTVKHDPKHPFSVMANHAVINDVGTTFAVRADANEPVHVAVTEGSVRLVAAGHDDSNGVVLKAGEHGTLQLDGQAIMQPAGKGEDDLAFTRGQLLLDNAPLDRVAAELRRWYGIELQFDPALTNRHVTASFQGEPVDQVLHVIGLVLGARIERNGNIAIVHTH